ncbi:MAG: ferrous iron transport protein B [Clostridia bacterium]|nr:ferrous iron transport protein B [Clostridia bacterium]
MINVCLVGNPNTGKTTLFNSLTGANEHVGNWHGVTVEEKAKSYQYNGEEFNIVDLPGIYSLSPLSFEEEVAVKYLLAHKDNLVLNICDASNLQRNLYLTLSLLELGVNVVLVINQIDKKPICKIDSIKLSQLLNIPIVHINAAKKQDMLPVNEALMKAAGRRPKYLLPYLNKLDLSSAYQYLPQSEDRQFYAIKLLEDDGLVKEKFGVSSDFGRSDDLASLRYEYIDTTLRKATSEKVRIYGKSRLDALLLNRFLALPIFLCMIALAFYLTFFTVGAWLSDGLCFVLDCIFFSPLSHWLSSLFGQASWVVGLFDNAIVGGVGSIISFLPQVGLLFLFLSILEDSGYLSRVAFVFDDLLAKVGLSGKAVYTLLMGFGCSTTAVLTARNMEDKNAKIKTAFLTPYMSCSAKFPIYSVLGGAFFGVSNIWLVMGLYLLGVAVAVLISFIFEKTILKSKAQSFILEFPPYRMMSVKRTMKLLLQNVKLFLTRVGSIIVAMNVVVWVLSNFTITLAYVPNGSGVSVLETLGRLFAPLFIPLGFGNWSLVASLIAGLVAKEVIVSSIAMFNGIEGGVSSIQSSISSLTAVAGFASASSMISFLVFCLLYVPCLATISVLAKEIGGKWTAFSIIVELAVAYVTSFVVFNIASACELFGTGVTLIFLATLLFVAFCVVLVVKKLKGKKTCPYKNKCLKKCKKG